MYYIGVWLLLFAVTALFNVLPNPLSVPTVSARRLCTSPVAVYAHFGQWRQARADTRRKRGARRHFVLLLMWLSGYLYVH